MQRFRKFISGGMWRNYMTKYPEANLLHKKMLLVSEKIHQLTETNQLSEAAVRRSLDKLWQAQVNDPYWHGVFGGLYLPHLRSAAYSNLIEVEKIVESELNQNNKFLIKHQITDMDKDGFEEVLVETPLLNAYFAPCRGGCLYELDFKPKCINLSDTLARRKEKYHDSIDKIHNTAENAVIDKEAPPSIHDLVAVKEKDLEQYLHYDKYMKHSFIDHFLDENTSIDSFANGEYHETGDFYNQQYRYGIKQQDDRLILQMERAGMLNIYNAKPTPLLVSKEIKVFSQSAQIVADYCLINKGHQVINCWFGVESNFSLLAGRAPDRYYKIPGCKLHNTFLASKGSVDNVSEVQLIDEYLNLGVQIKFDKAALLWRFPVETISLSEAGFERVYQSSVTFPNWNFNLNPNDAWNVTITLQLVSPL
jgi:alpha-amylase